MKKFAFILGLAFISLGIASADYSQVGEFQGCKDLGVMTSKVAQAELGMIKPYFPIAQNEDNFNIVKRFWMRYSELGISESEFQCMMAELKKNLASYYLDLAKTNNQTQNTSGEVEDLQNVLGWYPDNHQAMYLLAEAYEKNSDFYAAYKRYEAINKDAKNIDLQAKAKEKMNNLKEKVKSEVSEKEAEFVKEQLETAKKVLGKKASVVEDIAKELKTKDEATQKEIKAKIGALATQEDADTEIHNLATYLHYLLK